MSGIPVFPRAASTSAPWVDNLVIAELCFSAFIVVLIFSLVIYFVIRYRRHSEADRPPMIWGNYPLEIGWTVVPLLIALGMFYWGAKRFVDMKRTPANAMEIDVIGKQWMWKIEHPEGAREINELHVPVDTPIKLVMTSQDVIHDFAVPAFRLKQDVIPGSYSYEWFIATKPGTYHLFCDQYCGTSHAKMAGSVVVMAQADYQAWLAGHTPNVSPADAGASLFVKMGCAGCHGQRAPTMAGLYGTDVAVVFQSDGQIHHVRVDDDYLRESILYPNVKIAQGYPSVMPTYKGQVGEEQLFDLLQYIKSLGASHSATQPRLLTPATRPVNGQSPTISPNYPPAHEIGPVRSPTGE